MGFYLRFHFSGHSVLRILNVASLAILGSFLHEILTCGIFTLTNLFKKILKIDILYIILIEILLKCNSKGDFLHRPT